MRLMLITWLCLFAVHLSFSPAGAADIRTIAGTGRQTYSGDGGPAHEAGIAEPFGLTIAEAMSCGRPVVVAAAGGAAELFTPEYDGLGHTPGDTMELAAAISRLAADPALRAQVGANARRTAIEQFAHERYAREIAAIYTGCRRKQTASGSRR